MKALSSRCNVLVVGQGYVGLPLALELYKANFSVIGFDINKSLIKTLKLGISTVTGISNKQINDALNSGLLNWTSDLGLSSFDVAVICVPTPLNQQKKPDLTFLISAARLIGKNLHKGNLVILESTVAPGTTRNVLLPILVKESNLKENEFLLSYSPERIDPLNTTWHLKNTPKIVSGLNDKSLQGALNFYNKFVSKLVIANTLEAAETSKLLENSFRLVNIAFINEFWEICEKIGLDIQEIIKLAETKPYGYMPFYPSLGAGGHCIPVDPVYLLDLTNSLGVDLKVLTNAVDVNSKSPLNILKIIKKQFPDLNGKRVLLIGVSYKSNIADTRDSPVRILKNELERLGAMVYWHDELVQSWEGTHSVPITSNYDLAILATPHTGIELNSLGSVPLFDPRQSK